MAGNHNTRGVQLEQDSDILNLTDDVYFLEPAPVAKLQYLVYSEPRIGVVSECVRWDYFFRGRAPNPSVQTAPRLPIRFVKTSSNGCATSARDDQRTSAFDETFDERMAQRMRLHYRIKLAGWKVGTHAMCSEARFQRRNPPAHRSARREQHPRHKQV